MKKNKKYLLLSILSLSMLTTMWWSVLTPNLWIIQAYFSNIDPIYIRMLTSIASLSIMIVGIFFHKLTKKFKWKTLAIIWLLLYILGWCITWTFDNIYLMLFSRLILGVWIWIILPLSTGLVAYYYDKDQQNKLMWYSSAINCIWATITSLIAWYLWGISRRLCFLTYTIWIISFILVLLYLPSDYISNKDISKEVNNTSKSNKIRTVFIEYYHYIIWAFLVMACLFVYSQNFSIVTTQAHTVSHQRITWLSTIMALVAFFWWLFFGKLAKLTKNFIKWIIPIIYVLWFLSLAYSADLIYLVIWSSLVWLAKWMWIALMNAEASKQAGKYASSTVIPLIWSALYLSWLCVPFLLKLAEIIINNDSIFFPYYFWIWLSTVYLLRTIIIPINKNEKEKNLIIN